jgi:hypothetical protein
MLEVAAARNVFVSPVPSEEIHSEKLQAGVEDPQLLSLLHGLGVELEKDDFLAHSGFAEQGSYILDDEGDRPAGAFGLASLGDSPVIPDGVYEPAPGRSHQRSDEAESVSKGL